MTQQFKVAFDEVILRKRVSPVIGGKKYDLPSPTFCPDCRYQRRIANRNEWTLYSRKCDKTHSNIVSIYSADKVFPVYSQESWWSDDWNPVDYGKDFDFNKPFFEQFAELQKRVPRLAITNAMSENCDYTNQSQCNKDCYLVVASNNSEQCMYGNWYQNSRNCIDCYVVRYSDFCYECVDGFQLHKCLYTTHSENCSETYFSSDCKGCSCIFGCHGLRNKSYHIFNKPVTKEEWHEKVEKLALTEIVIANMRIMSRNVCLQTPQKYYQGKLNEGFSGDWLQNSKNVYNSFNARDAWDVWNSQDVWDTKNCLDMTETLTNESSIELEGCGLVHFSLVVSKSWENSNIYYCDLCFNSRDLLGCVGLRHKKYCLLNKQYLEAEYFRIVPRVIEHMKSTGKWGEFFPTHYSPFAYNESVAYEYFPLTKNEVLHKNWKWKDDLPYTTDQPTLSWTEVPEKISEVKDSIKEKVLSCQKCNRNYKIIASELSFYRNIGVPIPRKCAACRRNERYQFRNPRHLWDRQCMKCEKEIKTTYAPERPEIVYCEECYLKEVH